MFARGTERIAHSRFVTFTVSMAMARRPEDGR